MVAALYGAGAGALADAAVKRLGQVAPEAMEALRRDLKAAATGTRADEAPKQLESRAKRSSGRKPSAKAAAKRKARAAGD